MASYLLSKKTLTLAQNRMSKQRTEKKNKVTGEKATSTKKTSDDN